jgi:hypothetical protein
MAATLVFHFKEKRLVTQLKFGYERMIGGILGDIDVIDL